ncbi:TPA: hypothetical protein DCE37_19630 [Candidatus Latescibacteria bacterium]|nr:hypothetical protein [Candidatus Latescibacterota bacterium]
MASALTQEKCNVTIVETDRSLLDRSEEVLDIPTICDHGASPRVLDRAGVADADLVAAVTNSDEVNQIPAVTAKELGG